MVPTLEKLLKAYADALKPWARKTAQKMIGEVEARDRDYWSSLGNAISAQLRNDILRAPIGHAMREILDGQVHLITSLPTEAAERVHELTLKGLVNSSRAASYVEEIRRSGEVTQSRAVLIARTEVARTASVLTMERAKAAGSTHYTWETSEDGDVRPGHAEMQGKVCSWADPPAVMENGKFMHFHPGTIWNCRCWPRPLIPGLEAARR
jgi:SPP1 gp7 family putative phage head morphogenesis protein